MYSSSEILLPGKKIKKEGKAYKAYLQLSEVHIFTFVNMEIKAKKLNSILTDYMKFLDTQVFYRIKKNKSSGTPIS